MSVEHEALYLECMEESLREFLARRFTRQMPTSEVVRAACVEWCHEVLAPREYKEIHVCADGSRAITVAVVEASPEAIAFADMVSARVAQEFL
jgi:hypothetical protein